MGNGEGVGYSVWPRPLCDPLIVHIFAVARFCVQPWYRRDQPERLVYINIYLGKFYIAIGNYIQPYGLVHI